MSARQKPIYERLFDHPNMGGPRPRHLQRMIYELTKGRGNGDMPDLSYKDQHALGTYLKNSFANYQIEWAHNKAREYYSRSNQDRTQFRTPDSTDIPFPPADAQQAKLPPPETASDTQAETSTNNGTKAEHNQANDERYVLRTEYAANVKEQAKNILNLEDKITNINERINADNKTIAESLTAVMADVKAFADKKVTHVEIKTENSKMPEFTGIVHKSFPLLAKAANARLGDGCRLNFWLYGPAGTGKTHAAKSLANAFFGGKYRETNSKTMEEFQKQFNRDWDNYNYSPTLSTAFQVMGYMDANGRYVPTPFYLTWKYGGAFLLDEIDGSMQDALLGLNGALSSDYASFPCGIVKRHPDAIILAGANTTGHGGDIEYLGTMKQNVAFLDRWVFIHWPHDDALENSLVTNSHWVQRVRNVRAKLNSKKIKGHVITMRASMQGAALLEAGIPFAQVEEMVLRKGIPEGTWNLIK